MLDDSRLFHEVVLEHAKRTPDALAVSDGELEVSYERLDELSAQLARVLLDAGTSRGSIVALYIDRSAEWVVAMLAVLRVGGVCMPLDPLAPPDRALRALKAARPSLTLFSARSGASFPFGTDIPTASVDVSAKTPCTNPGLPAIRLGPEDAAYCMHTSGSSGQAKLVLAQHRWLTRGAYLGALVNGTTHSDRGSWLGAAGAGIAVHEVCNLLWSGASIHVGTRETTASPPALRDWLLENDITQAFVVTPVGEALQSLRWPSHTCLRLVTLGGDRLNRWGSTDLPFDLAVSYGSLEAFQIANTIYPHEKKLTPSTADQHDRKARPPVGRTLPGITVHLLEADRTPTPDGSIGEIWIESEGLCLGYLGDPALTADRFRPHFGGSPGTRIYRSGDAGRFRPDGILEHHGRIDDVVKIRGHRVELGDVEWTLGNHTKLEQVAVVPVDEEDGRVLVACFTAVDECTPLELRTYAAASLPSHMIPVAYVQMESLPLNANGKINRSVLPPAGWRERRPARAYRHPSSRLEAEVIDLFRRILGCEGVGADDHFMEMGGDSLSATRLQALIQDAYGCKVRMTTILDRGSAATIASEISQGRQDMDTPNHEANDRATLAGIRPRRKSRRP